MAKAQDVKKDVKKKAQKTLKEKRAEKKSKKSKACWSTGGDRRACSRSRCRAGARRTLEKVTAAATT